MQADPAEIQELKDANQRFYDAFGALDIDLMEEVWEDSDQAMCVHPGWQPLVGWDPIRASWRGIFDNTMLMNFNIQYVTAVIEGECGWVTCFERITTVTQGQASNFSTLVTNIFIRSSQTQDHRWKMIAHHASMGVG